jgi:hypothetical protein
MAHVLIPTSASDLGSILTAWAALSDQGADTSQARVSTARHLLAYLPIITANLLYTAIPLANRALVRLIMPPISAINADSNRKAAPPVRTSEKMFLMMTRRP